MKREFLNKQEQITESMAEDAARAEHDHEVQMARADCFYAAKDAIELHKILTGISEQQGLPGWVASKITLAADYLKSVKEYLEYKQMEHQTVVTPEPEVEFVEETTSAGGIATSMGGGNGFVDGGPGTVKRFKKRVSEGLGDTILRKAKVKTTKGKPNMKDAPRWASALGQTPQGAWHWLEKDGPVETDNSDKYFPLSGKTAFTGFISEGLPSIGAGYSTGSQGANDKTDDDADTKDVEAALKKAGNTNLANKLKTGTTFNKDELSAIIAAKG